MSSATPPRTANSDAARFGVLQRLAARPVAARAELDGVAPLDARVGATRAVATFLHMFAGELATPCPSVGMDDDALAAVRLMAEQRSPGIVVCEPGGRPSRILPGTQVLRFLIPPYVQDDAALARVIGVRQSDRLLGELAGRKVRDLLAERPDVDLAVARPDDTVLELAVIMARTHSPLVAVVERDRLIGCVTLPRLLDALLSPR